MAPKRFLQKRARRKHYIKYIRRPNPRIQRRRRRILIRNYLKKFPIKVRARRDKKYKKFNRFFLVDNKKPNFKAFKRKIQNEKFMTILKNKTKKVPLKAFDLSYLTKELVKHLKISRVQFLNKKKKYVR